MGQKKPGYTQVNLYLPEWAHKGLKRLIVDLDTSIQKWIEQIVTVEVVRLGYAHPPNRTYSSISELVTVHWDIFIQTSISPKNLKAYRDGTKPSELDLVRMSAALDMDECILVELCHKSFPNECKNIEEYSNGTV